MPRSTSSLSAANESSRARARVLASFVWLAAACSGASDTDVDVGGAGPQGSPTAAPTGTTPTPAGSDAGPTGPGADAAVPEGTFDAKLYVLPQTSFAVTRIGEAIEALVAAKPAIEDVIVYVHGRSCGGGGEPTKSLGSVVPEMETDYAAGVVMFFWPGSDDGCPLGFPEDQAKKAGPGLRATLASLAAWRASKPAALGSRPITLVTHSMGNLVLESALAQKTGVPADLVANAIVQSSATALGGHASWLSNLDFATRAFVTVNTQDKVLAAAEIGRSQRLGHGVGSEKLTPRAAYVDFSAAGVNHQYYVVSGQKGAGMKGFYQDVMRGRAYDLAGAAAIGTRTVRDGATVYTFK